MGGPPMMGGPPTMDGPPMMGGPPMMDGPPMMGGPPMMDMDAGPRTAMTYDYEEAFEEDSEIGFAGREAEGSLISASVSDEVVYADRVTEGSGGHDYAENMEVESDGIEVVDEASMHSLDSLS
mmetsp:Transcript_83322/g.199964  ORF Transcript_83322/g.199964 Transcript_83322/m.199964 type:complete len:123 (+) Transcript_83322:2-370(+)